MLGGDVSGWGDAAGGAGWTLALGEGTFGLRSLLCRLRIVTSECVCGGAGWGSRSGHPGAPLPPSQLVAPTQLMGSGGGNATERVAGGIMSPKAGRQEGGAPCEGLMGWGACFQRSAGSRGQSGQVLKEEDAGGRGQSGRGAGALGAAGRRCGHWREPGRWRPC